MKAKLPLVVLSLVTILPSAIWAQNNTPVAAQTAQMQNAGKNCLDGAKTSVLAAALVTGIGCVADMFVSGGALCATYLAVTGAKVATVATVGCVVGALSGSPASAASSGAAAAPSILAAQ